MQLPLSISYFCASHVAFVLSFSEASPVQLISFLLLLYKSSLTLVMPCSTSHLLPFYFPCSSNHLSLLYSSVGYEILPPPQPRIVPVVTYSGLESERATLELFGGAAGVVGYHGAGLVNSVFIPHAACVVEISTFLSTQRENSSIPWRANEHRRTLAWSPAMLTWRYHRLSLDQILTANRVEIPRDANDLRRPTTRQRRNDFIKTLPLVPLSDADVISIGRLLRSCMIRKKVLPKAAPHEASSHHGKSR